MSSHRAGAGWMRVWKRGSALALGLAMPTLPSSGAVITLTSDRKVEGKLLQAGPASVTLETFEGTQEFPVAQVRKRDEKTKSRYEEYLELLEKTPKDVDGHMMLAKFCIKAKAWQKADEHLAAAQALEPDNKKVLRVMRESASFQDDLEVAKAKGSPSTPLSRIPRRAGEWLVQGRDRKYWVQVPKGIESDTPVPLVRNFSWLVVGGKDGFAKELAMWRGFEGIVVTPIEDYTATLAVGQGILEEVSKALPVDRDAVLVCTWWGAYLPYLIGARPDLFQYGFEDSTLGGHPWPAAPSVDDAQRKHFAKTHIYYKLTGVDYKEEDRGYDDAQMKQVQEYWESLGVKDLVVERYPASKTYPKPDYANCIGRDGSGRARRWFLQKLKEKHEKKEKAASAAKSGH